MSRLPEQFGQRGFTLLEVLVALSITALGLGALFGLLGESRSLARRALVRQDGLIRARAELHAAFLGEDLGTLQAAPPFETGLAGVAPAPFSIETEAGRISGIRLIAVGRPD